MEDSFEKSIRETLGNPPDFPFDEEVWKKLETKLNRQETAQHNSRAIAWWWLLLAALLPGLLAGWLFLGQQQDQQRMDLLEAQIARTSQYLDTVVQKRVTIIYDTIIQQTTIIKDTDLVNSTQRLISYQLPLLSSYPLFQADQRLPFFNTNTFYPSVLSKTQKHLSGRHQRTKTEGLTTESTASLNTLATKVASPLAYLENNWNYLEYASITDLPPVSPTPLKGSRHSTAYYLAKIKPRSLSIAAGAGVFSSLHLPETVGINPLKSGQAGFGFGRHWHLSIGLEHLNLSFRLKENEANRFNEFPAPTPNDPDDEQEGLTGTFNYWQFPVGVKYRLLVEKRIQPYLGAGLMGVLPTTASLIYIFEAENSDTKYNIIQNDLLPQVFKFTDAYAFLGVQWHFRPRLGLWAELSTQQRWQKGGFNFQKNQFTKAQLGASYRF